MAAHLSVNLTTSYDILDNLSLLQDSSLKLLIEENKLIIFSPFFGNSKTTCQVCSPKMLKPFITKILRDITAFIDKINDGKEEIDKMVEISKIVNKLFHGISGLETLKSSHPDKSLSTYIESLSQLLNFTMDFQSTINPTPPHKAQLADRLISSSTQRTFADQATCTASFDENPHGSSTKEIIEEIETLLPILNDYEKMHNTLLRLIESRASKNKTSSPPLDNTCPLTIIKLKELSFAELQSLLKTMIFTLKKYKEINDRLISEITCS